MTWEQNDVCACPADRVTEHGTATVEGTTYCNHCRCKVNVPNPGKVSVVEDAIRPGKPGWYPVSESDDSELRYWDGQNWTEDYAVAEVPKPPSGFEVKTRESTPSQESQSRSIASELTDIYAWGLAFSPLLALSVTGVLVATRVVPGELVWLAFTPVFIALVILFDYLDKNKLRSAGYHPPFGQSLYGRSRMVGRGGGIFGVQLVMIALTLLLIILVQNGKFIAPSGETDSQRVEQEIANGIQEQSGYVAIVNCPEDVPTSIGETYSCTAQVNGSSVVVSVSVTSTDGKIYWTTGYD